MKLQSAGRLILLLGSILISVFSLGGCHVASQSPSPTEFIKDPLGIDRAINEYYFPESKQPKSTWGSEFQISENDPSFNKISK